MKDWFGDRENWMTSLLLIVIVVGLIVMGLFFGWF